MKSEQINELAKALAIAQSEIRGAVKDAANPFFKSTYADLSSVWEACRVPLHKNGLAVTQTTDVVTGGVILTTTLMHVSGQWIAGQYPIEPTKKDPQGLGAAMTYARRYTLAAIVGVCSIEDDDAESAIDRSKAKPDLRTVPKQVAIQSGKPTRAVAAAPVFHPDDAQDEYVIPFGQLKGKRLTEVSPRKLIESCDYWHERAKKDGKPLTGQPKEFVDRVAALLAGQG